MRITIPVISAGNRWTARVPRVDVTRCYPNGADGKPEFDEAEFRRQVRCNPRVQIGSEDAGHSAVAFGAILLSSLCDWMDDNSKDGDSLPRYRETMSRIDRRIERGNVTYCRIDVRPCRQQFKGREIVGVRVEITTDGKGVVQSAPFEREFAMMVCDFCETYSARYAERNDPPLVFGPSAMEIAKELHERTVEDERERKLKELNANRWKCERRTATGYCSPCKFDCPCFCGGMCVEAKEVKGK